MKEFDLIERFFERRGRQRKDVIVGIGDDCAILKVPDNKRLAITTDTLVENVHFLAHTPPRSVAYKAVAVNLSDLAAMGAEPAWISLSITLPDTDEAWLESFSEGLYELLEYYSVDLIGGDTVKGPLSLTITAQGFIPENCEIRRSGAKPGDWIYVSGTLGDAGAGLEIAKQGLENLNESQDYLVNRHFSPTPRVMLGNALRRVASSCIDVSDGTLADLQHILERSDVGARVHIGRLPLSDELVDVVGIDDAVNHALTSGDDYELLFTVSEEQRGQLETILGNCDVQATCIGQITGQKQKIDLRLGDMPFSLPKDAGFEHFSG
ncbi:thiamine-phosphate kinase [Alteromonas sp. 5E99-2]|uniref:thiamine-phosphate kinase n=1 Tax=Alteromonas sp. 5E99-2 TaxID=2817683 RepID=UPI001A994EA3|nr:thiamine-phosphate kinase [Alteromonas sp. 5E99-2]